MTGYLLLLLVLGVIPVVIGLPWTKALKPKYFLAFAYCIGFFEELTLFHLIVCPATFLYLSFRFVTVLYSILLFILCVVSLLFIKKYELYKTKKDVQHKERFNWLEWIVLTALLVTIGLQIVRGFTYDITYMSYDDSLYTTEAADALDIDGIGTVNSFTGVGGIVPNIQRAIQTSLVFPSYFSAISGVSVATMEHTIQYVQLIILSYFANLYLAGELFKKRENALIFLLIISVFYIFGYHSHYSLTFRLLGPNYQGKAILAVSLTPVILTILLKVLNEPYQWKPGVLLLILSLSAVSLTLWGIGTIAVIVIMPIFLSFFRKGSNWKHLLYTAWGCIGPACFLTFYMFNK